MAENTELKNFRTSLDRLPEEGMAWEYMEFSSYTVETYKSLHGKSLFGNFWNFFSSIFDSRFDSEVDSRLGQNFFSDKKYLFAQKWFFLGQKWFFYAKKYSLGQKWFFS